MFFFMKELDLKFEGRGEVSGYSFVQLFKSPFGYIYEKTHLESGVVSYEVFRRMENVRFDCVCYPRSKSFGVWAFEFGDLNRAKRRFEEINIHGASKLSEEKVVDDDF